MSSRPRYPSDERTRLAKAARRALHGQEPRPSGKWKKREKKAPVARPEPSVRPNLRERCSLPDPDDYSHPLSDVRSTL